MKLDLKEIIEQGNLTKSERVELVLKNLQTLYLNELEDARKKIENIKRVIELTTNIPDKKENE